MKFKLSISLIVALALLYPYRPVNKTKPAFRCTISSVKKSYKVGEVPQLQVTITNESDKDVYLIGSLDGSDIQWRMPYCYFTLQKPVPGPDSPRVGRCKTLNPLRKEDFTLVKAGASFNPYQTIDGYGFFEDHETLLPSRFSQPGMYTIQFHYNSNSGSFHQFRIAEKDSALLHTIFSKAAKVELSSNKLELRFEQ
jgi:hypothetical protein